MKPKEPLPVGIGRLHKHVHHLFLVGQTYDIDQCSLTLLVICQLLKSTKEICTCTWYIGLLLLEEMHLENEKDSTRDIVLII